MNAETCQICWTQSHGCEPSAESGRSKKSDFFKTSNLNIAEISQRQFGHQSQARAQQ